MPKALSAVLAQQGIEQAFPIQEKTLPDSLAGRDVLGRGKTGSGKTVAFALPLVSRLAGLTGNGLRVSILVVIIGFFSWPYIGRIVRGLHFFGASFIVIAAVLHMLRVVLFGSYKKPREVTWITGVVLLLVILLPAFLGSGFQTFLDRTLRDASRTAVAPHIRRDDGLMAFVNGIENRLTDEVGVGRLDSLDSAATIACCMFGEMSASFVYCRYSS